VTLFRHRFDTFVPFPLVWPSYLKSFSAGAFLVVLRYVAWFFLVLSFSFHFFCPDSKVTTLAQDLLLVFYPGTKQCSPAFSRAVPRLFLAEFISRLPWSRLPLLVRFSPLSRDPKRRFLFEQRSSPLRPFFPGFPGFSL